MRTNALHQATAQIVARTKPDAQRPRVIVLEDLHIAGMLKNRRLARAIADVGMYEFKRQILYKAEQAGVKVVLASRWEPSSKTCTCCGWVNETLRLADRVFVCMECGSVQDRDYNAPETSRRWPNEEEWRTASSAGSDACGADVRRAKGLLSVLKQEPNTVYGMSIDG